MERSVKKHERFWICVIVVSLVAAVFLGRPTSKVPICLWKRLFGVACPGCGMLRGISAWICGRFGEALSYNYLALPILLVVCFVWIGMIYDQIKSGIPFYRHMHALPVKRWMVIPLLVVVLINWMSNIYRGL